MRVIHQRQGEVPPGADDERCRAVGFSGAVPPCSLRSE